MSMECFDYIPPTSGAGAAPRFLTPRSIGDGRTSSTDPTFKTVSVATSASAHTKGSWVEVIASTSAEADLLTLYYAGTNASSGNGLALADIGIGVAGAETVLVENIQVGNSPARTSHDIPINVPAGSRLSVRWQAARASATAATFGLMPQTIDGFTAPSTIDTIGANTGTSGGVVLTSSNNVYTQITAAAAQDYQGFVVTAGCSNTAMNAGVTVFDLGVGASGSEVPYLSNHPWNQTASEEMLVNFPLGSTYISVDVEAGTRVSARLITSQASYTGYNVVLLGVPA